MKSPWALAPVALAMFACDSTAGGSLNACQDNIPAPCGAVAHCVLDSSEFLSGQFPGSQVFIVRAEAPEMITFSFEFTNRISAGTFLNLTSTEPDCSERSTYMNTSDIFQMAGANGILSFPITMTEPGDHLVQFSSDAYCSYQLSYQVGGS
jgi:hypothetical protein